VLWDPQQLHALYKYTLCLAMLYLALLTVMYSGFGGLEVACWVQTRPKPSDFSGEKILSTPSFGGEVKPSVSCRALRHVKERKSDVEVATFGKISRPFLTHSSTFRCWVR
jgi:hypothetical protein